MAKKTNPHVPNREIDCLSAARSYAQRGWSPIPIPAGEKAPNLKGWQNLNIALDEYPQFFSPGMNIGILLGESSGWLIDIDLDCADALFLAPEFLPSTDATFGRPSKPESHLLFRVYDAVDTLRLKGVDGAVIVELRGNGCQTVFPPSIHSGEQVEWVRDELPRLVDGLELRKSVVLLAIACLIVPCWPEEGSRHEFALSLSGGLLSDGLEPESVKRIITGVCHAAGDDEIRDRLAAVHTTARKLTEDQPATGWGTFRAQVGNEVVDKIRNFVALIVRRNPEPKKEQARNPRKSESGSDDGKTTAERLLDLAKEAKLYHTPDKEALSTVPVGAHVENWPLQSREFRSWLLKLYYEAQGKPPSREAMNDAIAMLEARALFDGPECLVFTRLGYRDGKIFLDLCDQDWRVARVSPEGWEILDSSPVHFRRARGMLALPTPIVGGSLAGLRNFITALDERSWTLLISWLVAAVYPQGPFPILVLQGEAGTAKSTTSLILRTLIDPSKAPLRSMPRDDRDLMISAQNSWVISLDNLSRIPVWLSDALCRLATGGGLATRELYTNDSEKIFDSKRPIILNGIDELAERDDLADRALVVNLARIPEDRRRSQRELLTELETAGPRILGGLLDVLSRALANLDGVRLSALPRMADFAQLITAAEPALGWPPGLFMRVYMEDRADKAAGWVESDSVAVAVLGFMKNRGPWSGTSTELLAEFNAVVDPNVKQSRAWPQTPQSLSNRIRRAAPSLRISGIEMEFDRESRSRRRLIVLKKWPQTSVPSGLSVPCCLPDPDKTPNLNEGEPKWTDADTGDDDLRNQGRDHEPGDGLAGGTSVALDPIWRCADCGNGFDSRFAWRLHELGGSCGVNRKHLGGSSKSENVGSRGEP